MVKNVTKKTAEKKNGRTMSKFKVGCDYSVNRAKNDSQNAHYRVHVTSRGTVKDINGCKTDVILFTLWEDGEILKANFPAVIKKAEDGGMERIYFTDKSVVLYSFACMECK